MLFLSSCPPHRVVLRCGQENVELLEPSCSGKGSGGASSVLECVGGFVSHHIPVPGWSCVGQGKGLALTAEQRTFTEFSGEKRYLVQSISLI